MLFDTDILIWVQRGNLKAAEIINNENERFISIYTYMELLQCAKNKESQRYIKGFLKDLNFITLPLLDNIGHRASIYIEEYSLSNGLRAGDAIIASNALENNIKLCSSNIKHYKMIKNLRLHEFIL